MSLCEEGVQASVRQGLTGQAQPVQSAAGVMPMRFLRSAASGTADCQAFKNGFSLFAVAVEGFSCFHGLARRALGRGFMHTEA